MVNIVKGQSIRLTSTLGVDITGATLVCNYRKPSGASGTVPVVITTGSTGAVYADLTATILDEAGIWSLYISGTLLGGNVVKSFGEKLGVLDEYVEE